MTKRTLEAATLLLVLWAIFLIISFLHVFGGAP